MSDALITVGLPTLGREKELVDTIRMVLAQDYKDLELIVADQTKSHTAETADFINKTIAKDKRLKYFQIQPQNLPAARNFILSRAKGEILLYIDDDIEIKKGYVGSHVKSHRDHPEAVAIGGRIIQDKVPLSDHPTFFDELALPHGTFNCPNSGEAASFPGGNHSIQTKALKKIGGYNTSYNKIALREESDTAFRLLRAGYTIYYDAEVPLVHLAAPYGGCRIYVHQHDNPWFFVNDLFFTFRVVRKKFLLKALFKKYILYTKGSTFKNRLKKNAYFSFGLVTAFFMYLLKPSHEAKEVK
jgi:glycosyltransferase involved in cell wall biosynthesis